MSTAKKRNPARLGLFVVGALVLLFVLVFSMAGGQLLARKQPVVMHFNGSIYGLQIGAPVVIRGVRLGSVSAIALRYDRNDGKVVIPVTAELDRELLRSVSGVDGSPAEALTSLVQRGLRAQLALQSLLTGQLYVDLDFRPDKPAQRVSEELAAIEIPTVSTAFQDLQNQVDELDLKRLVTDISAIAASARGLLAKPELGHVVEDLAAAARHLKQLSATLDKQADPLLGSLRGSSEAARRTLLEMGQAASEVGATAQRAGAALDGVATTLGPDAPLVQSLRRTADELTQTAVALRQATANESPLNQQLQRSLQDVAKSARALRELAETLDQQPESVLKGRR